MILLITNSNGISIVHMIQNPMRTSEGNKCPSFLLVPTVVTKDNMEEELVDTGYYTKDDDGYLHPVQ